jgi:hypothetical protein
MADAGIYAIPSDPQTGPAASIAPAANGSDRGPECVQARMNEALHGAMHLVSRLCDRGISERERTNCALKARGSLRQLELMIDEVLQRGDFAQRRETSVAAVFSQVREAIGAQLLERGLGLKVHDNSRDVGVAGAGALAAGTLSTLTGIAAENLSSGDELELSARLERDMVVFAVRAREALAEGRGFRLAVAPLATGSGFMLEAARRFAEIHGGALRMPGTRGAGYGAEFRLELPRRPQSRPAAERSGEQRKVA